MVEIKTMKIQNIPHLLEMIEQKYVSVHKHPAEELYIYNYTPKTQFDRVWNDVTLQTRGLILDGEYNIVARPFKKFFNYEELKQEDIPNLPFEIFEKYDGSMIIAFYYKNAWFVASRGSFISEQAQKGKELFNKLCISCLNIENTYIFEILY